MYVYILAPCSAMSYGISPGPLCTVHIICFIYFMAHNFCKDPYKLSTVMCCLEILDCSMCNRS